MFCDKFISTFMENLWDSFMGRHTCETIRYAGCTRNCQNQLLHQSEGKTTPAINALCLMLITSLFCDFANHEMK